MAGLDALERVDVDAAFVERHTEHTGARGLQRGERPDEGRGLADDDVARAYDGAADQVDALPRTRRDDELVGRTGEPARLATPGELDEQLRHALRLAVAEHRPTMRQEQLVGHPTQLLDRMQLG